MFWLHQVLLDYASTIFNFASLLVFAGLPVSGTPSLHTPSCGVFVYYGKWLNRKVFYKVILQLWITMWNVCIKDIS